MFISYTTFLSTVISILSRSYIFVGSGFRLIFHIFPNPRSFILLVLCKAAYQLVSVNPQLEDVTIYVYDLSCKGS